MFAFLDDIFSREKIARRGLPRWTLTSYSKNMSKKNHSYMFVSGKLTNDSFAGQLTIGLCNRLELDLVSPFEKVKQTFLGD